MAKLSEEADAKDAKDEQKEKDLRKKINVPLPPPLHKTFQFGCSGAPYLLLMKYIMRAHVVLFLKRPSKGGLGWSTDVKMRKYFAAKDEAASLAKAKSIMRDILDGAYDTELWEIASWTPKAFTEAKFKAKPADTFVTEYLKASFSKGICAHACNLHVLFLANEN